VDIIFKGRQTDVLDRFREHAAAKLAKIGRLDQKAVRVDVEVSAERNPRQSERRERVELTIASRGPTIRAEAAAEDRYTALDLAFAKLESRLRRALDRRKSRHSGHAAARLGEPPAAGAELPGIARSPEDGVSGTALAARPGGVPAARRPGDAAADDSGQSGDDVVPIEMQGEGPVVVREKFHRASSMEIDQALFEMELLGHGFFLFRDARCGYPSVVYRRRGYQYGVIRLVEESAIGGQDAGDATLTQADGQASEAEKVGAR
jgi:ribosomal subunit interface protein